MIVFPDRHNADTTYLIGAPSINDKAAAEIRLRSWPEDEEGTTQEIYAAAEEIRNRRPRYPVGYTVEVMEVMRGSVRPLDGRCLRGKG